MKWPLLNTATNDGCGNFSYGQMNTQTCGFSMRGFSYYTSYMYGYSSWSSTSYYRTYNYSYTYYDTNRFYSYDTFGFLLDISGNMADLDMFKIKFSTSNQSSGHRLWEGYTMPDINGRVVKNSAAPGLCMVTQFNFPVIYSDNNSLLSDKVVMETVGEFIFYRSRASPVEVKTEECTSSSRKLCICGVTFRDGESIHTVNYCNGVVRVGQLYGNSNKRDLKKVRFTNGMLLSLSIADRKKSSFVLMLSNILPEEGEGLCTFSPGSFKFRNGVESSSNTGFLTSWSILTEESLLNPVNHKPYQWVEKYALCYCPIDSKTRNVTSSYSYNNTYYVYTYEYANVYTSHFRCSSQNQCSTNHSGEEWKDSLLPAFAVDDVVAKMEIRYNGDLPLLYLICAFDKQDNLRYKITWKLDNVIIFQSKVMSATDAGTFYVTNNNFKTNKFLLEAAFSCGVSVHDASNKMLIDALFSDDIRAIEFVATEILLPRGGDINVQLKLNIPLVCKKKSRCNFDFKLYDPKESYSCSDSTIAFKSKDTCGTRVVVGVSDRENSRDSYEDDVPDVVNEVSFVNITVTTKNNNAYVLRDTFTLKMRLAVTGETSSFWTNTFSNNLTVFVRDDEAYWQRNYCYANNDPRMRTFDGQYYTNVLVDEFIMMKHKKLPVEVQLETHYGGWYSCGVTVRAGRDVYTINHCHGDHITSYLLADDRILKVKKRNEHRYEIYLPHGTRIDVQINTWRDYIVNVYIYPSPSDMKQVEGLCGNFDGDINGDLVHSDGSVTYASYYYWWWWWISNPNSFIQSWGVNMGNQNFQSLINIEAIEESLKSWYADDVLCICTGGDGNGEVKCSANERDTCKSPKKPPGKDVSIKKRDKRSGQILDSEYKFRTRKMREKRAAYRANPQKFVRRRSIEDEEIAVNDSIALCRQMLSSSCNIMSVQNDGLNVTFEELVFNCGQDKAANPEVDWTALTCAAIETFVEHEIRLDVQFQKDNPELISNITENLCVGNCSGNGNCLQGECVCFAGFTASDCSLDLSLTVAIEGITGDGICDINSYDCTCIRLTTSGSIENTKYNLRHREIQTNGSLKETGTYVGTVVYDNFNEVFVCVEVASRRKRSTGGWTSIGDQYDIALSNNDGTTFSNSTKVYVLDTTCLKVNNASDTVFLLPGFCIIHGVCYPTNTTSSTDACYFCNDTANQFDWTRDGKESCSPVSESSGVQAYVIGIAVAVSALAVIAVVIVAVCVVKKTLATRIAVYDGDLFEMSKNKQTIVVQLRKEETVEEIAAVE